MFAFYLFIVILSSEKYYSFNTLDFLNPKISMPLISMHQHSKRLQDLIVKFYST